MTTDRYATDRERQAPFVVSQRLSARALSCYHLRRRDELERVAAGAQAASQQTQTCVSPPTRPDWYHAGVLVHPLPPGGYAPGAAVGAIRF